MPGLDPLVEGASPSEDDGDQGNTRQVRSRPSRWWLSGECVVVGLLAGTVWFGGGGQTAHAIVAFAATVFATAAACFVRIFIEPRLLGLAVWRVAFCPFVVAVAFVVRDPLCATVFELRFRSAEPTLTAAAQAALLDPDAPMPDAAGGWTFTDRWRFDDRVVFFADGVGPLLLDRCGFAYVPSGTPRLNRIRGDWYWLCV